MEYQHVTQPFMPVYNKDSKILILGSFPSVKSREQGFYYGHKQNRFWKVIAAIVGEEVPVTIEQKKEMLYKNGIAVYDVIESCDIRGSSDSSIKNVVPADILHILENSKISCILTNGGAATRLYEKYQSEICGISAVALPSTSPANAAFSLEHLIEVWGEALKKRIRW